MWASWCLSARSTYLKRVMRSIISSCETSGNFLRSLNASIAAVDVVDGRDGYMRRLGHRPLTSLPDIYATGPGGDPPARHLPLPTARRTAASLSPLSTCCATNFALVCCGPSPPRLRVSRNYRMWTRKTAVVSWTMTARSSQDRGESTCLFSRTFAPSRVRKRQWRMVWRTRRPECLFARSARPAGQRTRSLGAAQPSNNPLPHLVAPSSM